MAEQRAQRRLAAILAADVVGYSRMMQQDEAGTLAILKDRRKTVLEPTVANHGGRIIKLVGDGALIEFASAVDAVECAARLQERMAAGNADQSDGLQIVLRIGVNLGDVVVDGDDLYGDGVNIAARLEALADPGGVWISEDAYRQVRSKLALSFDDLGARVLKNIAEPVRIYRVTNTPAVTVTATTTSTPEKPSIAVLPFANLSGDPEQDYFADGIVADLITQLSRLRDLLVIARNSTLMFKGRTVRVQDVARDLGVRFILEGSVRRAGNRIRVTAQLIDGASGGHVWAERYDRELTDFFELQDEITKAVTVALQVNLTEGDTARIAAEGTRNLEAWEAFLQGQTAILKFTKLDNIQARFFYERAVHHDANYALAFVMLAHTHWLDARLGFTPDPAISLGLAKAALQRAEDLVGETGAVLHYKGNAALMERRHDEALEFHRRAGELAPSDAYCAAAFGMTQVYSGDFQGAIATLKTSRRLSPYAINWAIYYLAWADLWQGDLEQARSDAALYLAREPNEPFAYILSAITAAATGRLDAARGHITVLLGKHPEMTRSGVAAAQFYRDPERLQRIMAWLKDAGLPE